MSGINGLLHKQQQPQKKGTTTKAHVGVSTGTETAAAIVLAASWRPLFNEWCSFYILRYAYTYHFEWLVNSDPLVMCCTTDMENYFSSSYSITIVVLLLCLLTIHTYPIYVHISSTIDMEEDRHAVASLLWSQYPHTIRGRRRWKWLFYALCQTNEFVFREMTTISIWSFSKEAAASFHSLNFSSSLSLYSRDKPQQQQQQLLGLCIWKLRAALTWMPRVVSEDIDGSQAKLTRVGKAVC